MKKKILFITQHFFPENFPINFFIKKLQNYSKFVLTTYPTYPNIKYYKNFKRNFYYKEEIFEKKIVVYRVNSSPRIKDNFWNFVKTYISFVVNATLFCFFKLNKNSFDYIFVYATSPLIQALIAIFYKKFKAKNAKIIIWVQDLWPESLLATGYVRNSFLLKVIEKVVNFIYQNSDVILTQSESLKKIIYLRSKNKNIFYLPNLSQDFFLKKKQNKQKNNVLKVLYAGNFGKIQSLELFLDTIYKLKNKKEIKFQFVGSGSLENYIINYKHKHNLNNLEISSYKNYNDMRKIYDSSDILLVSLKKNALSRLIIPSKVQSYMSTGKPILSCIKGETNNLIKNSNCGFCIDSHNTINLSKLILRISKMSNSDLKKKGRNGRKFFLNNFSNEKIFSKFKLILRNQYNNHA